MLKQILNTIAVKSDGYFRRWLRDVRAGFSVQFAVALVPLTAVTGGAVDFSTFGKARTTLESAADSAVLAAVGHSTLNMDPTAARTVGLNTFNGLASITPGVKVTNVTLSVDDSGLSRTATLNYTAETPTNMLQIMGIKSVPFSGKATASFSKSPYIDFYLLLDNTPSMGVGATSDDITKMVNNTPDRCAFACHDLSNSNSYYTLAKRLGVTMRIDVLRTATQQLMDTAAQTATAANQFRMAIYTFGGDAQSMGLTSIAPLTSNLAAAKTQASAIDLMTVPNSSYNTDQDTPFDQVLAAMNTAIPSASVGAGVDASQPQKVLFFVSDGVADQYLPSACTRPTTGGRCQEPLTVSLCSAIKARGVKIAVLYTTYLPLPTNGWYNSWIAPFSGSIATNMQACASPGLYFEVSPSGGIADAMTVLFRQAILSARLTQ